MYSAKWAAIQLSEIEIGLSFNIFFFYHEWPPFILYHSKIFTGLRPTMKRNDKLKQASCHAIITDQPLSTCTKQVETFRLHTQI